MRALVLATLLCVGLGATAATVCVDHAAAGETTDALPDPKKKRPHPLYPDGDTLDWSTKLAEAQAIAKGRRRLIFIEYGRET